MNPSRRGWSFRRLRVLVALGPILVVIGLLLVVLQPGDQSPPLATAAGGLAVAIGVVIWHQTIVSIIRLTDGIENLQFALRSLAAEGPGSVLDLPDLPQLAGLTETLRILAERLQSQAAAENRQRRVLETVLDAIPSAVLVIGPDRRLRLLNERARALLGPVSSDCTASLEMYLRDSRLAPGLNQALHEQKGSAFELTLEPAPTGAGVSQVRVLSAVVLPVRTDNSGNDTGAVVTLHDITNLRRLELARRELIANVSHELKTPVAIIRGFSETLQAGALHKPEAEGFLDRIVEASARIGELVERLLLLARLEEPDFRPRRRLLNLNELVAELVKSWRQVAVERGVDIALDLPETPIMIQADAELLRQAIDNLTDNALRYSPKGTVVRLAVVPDESAGQVAIRVADQGRGLAPEHRERIFERFFRPVSDRSRSDGGTGLGLAIVKHVAQAHQGTATVRSEPGRGAEFSVNLPLLPVV